MNDQLHTVKEMMDQDDHEASRKMVQLIAAILIGVGLMFTGYLNFQLYSRAFSADSKIFGIIPAILIEGSLATFLLGSFVWFSHGTQGKLSKFFGWAMFGIVALNTIVEFNAQLATGTDASINDFLKIYTVWGVPVVVPLVIGFWKAVIDADPSIQIMRQKRKMSQTLQMALHAAEMKEHGSEASRQALDEYGKRSVTPLYQRLRGDTGNTGTNQSMAADRLQDLLAHPEGREMIADFLQQMLALQEVPAKQNGHSKTRVATDRA